MSASGPTSFVLPSGLLGGHVAGRAHDRVGPRQAAVRGQRLGQAEVGDLGRAVGRQQDVARLQVAVDDAQAVRLGDAVRQRLDQLDRLPRRPGGAGELPVQAPAIDELQLEERQAVGLAAVVDLHDVGVLQAGDGLRLGQEAAHGLVVGMGTRQDHLQDAGAFQEDLPGAVDDAHAAAAQLAQDLVAVDGGGGPLAASGQRVVVWPRHGQVGRRIAGRRDSHDSPGFCSAAGTAGSRTTPPQSRG